MNSSVTLNTLRKQYMLSTTVNKNGTDIYHFLYNTFGTDFNKYIVYDDFTVCALHTNFDQPQYPLTYKVFPKIYRHDITSIGVNDISIMKHMKMVSSKLANNLHNGSKYNSYFDTKIKNIGYEQWLHLNVNFNNSFTMDENHIDMETAISTLYHRFMASHP